MTSWTCAIAPTVTRLPPINTVGAAQAFFDRWCTRGFLFVVFINTKNFALVYGGGGGRGHHAELWQQLREREI